MADAAEAAKRFYPLALLIVVLVGAALRVPELQRRPMHTDEAVHAIKFGMLLEDGEYVYDRTEYHGPTLNYFSLIPAWIESAESLGEVDEATLRIVPVAFALGLLLALPLLTPGLGRPAIVAAAVVTAVSPAMVFYSRYYIQETLLVFFTFAALALSYRYLRAPRGAWAAAAGACLGLMHATKETAVIAFGALAVAGALSFWTNRAAAAAPPAPPRAVLVKHGLIALLTAIAVSALFYSSFFTNPAGVIDSYSTYASYFSRAHHEWHIHPWHYYVGMLAYFRTPGGPLWTEGFILLLAGIGIAAVFAKRDLPGIDRRLVRFVGFYAITLLVVYSVIPYKTPWNMLSALQSLIVLAGVGAAATLEAARSRPARLAVAGLLIVGIAHLGLQSYLGSYRYDTDTSNPYVYAHPTGDVIRIGDRVEALAAVHPDGHDMYIEVISPDSDYWPLPWYLRGFPNTGWWDEVDLGAPPAPVIIAAPSVEPALLDKLYQRPPPGQRNLYLPLFAAPTELRPTIEIRGYVVKDLWDAFVRTSEPSTPGASSEPAGRGPR